MANRSPTLPALLSLVIPGLGQLSLGHRERGGLILLMMLLFIGLLLWLQLSPLYWLILLPFWAMNVFDAYVLASERRPDTTTLFLLGALPLYVMAWQATDINLQRLFSNVNKVQPLLSGLFQPLFLEQDREIAIASQQFYVPCPVTETPEVSTASAGGTIETSVTCGNVGETMTLRGEGFPANQQVALWWVNPVNANSRIRIQDAYEDFPVGADGSFEGEIVIPEAIPRQSDQPPDRHRIEVRYVASEGGWFITETAIRVLGRMGETIAQALMATLVGAILAAPFSFFGARNLMAGNPGLVLLYYFSRGVMNILRSVEPLIMAIVFVVWVGLGPFAGVLALVVHTIAALGKLYSESIESIDEGPIEAIRSTGANQFQIIAYGVLPQVLPPWIAFTVYRWDINVRMSTIIGFVGGGGIGFLLAQWIRLQDFRSAGAAIWAIAVVVILLDYLSAKVRERIM